LHNTSPPVIFFVSIPVKGTAKALAVDLLKINPENVRRAPPLFYMSLDFKQSYSSFWRKLASLVWLDHVNKTSSFHFVYLIGRFPSRSKSRHMLEFTLKDQSPFEYLRANRVYINGKDKPCYVSIISKCLNLNNLVIPIGANWK